MGTTNDDVYSPSVCRMIKLAQEAETDANACFRGHRGPRGVQEGGGMSELKPCPFCGGTEGWFSNLRIWNCAGCRAQGPWPWLTKPADWNTRPEESRLAAEVATCFHPRRLK